MRQKLRDADPPGFCRCRHARRGVWEFGFAQRPAILHQRADFAVVEVGQQLLSNLSLSPQHNSGSLAFTLHQCLTPGSIPTMGRWPRLWREGCRALDVDQNPQRGFDKGQIWLWRFDNSATDRIVISGRQDLNLRHLAPKASALPNCATPRNERIATPALQIIASGRKARRCNGFSQEACADVP